MNHERMKEKLQAFRDRELAETEREEMAQHLSFCGECRGTLRRWELFSSALLRVASPESSEAFTGGVMARLADLEAPGPMARRGFFPDWLLPALGYGFALALMVIAITHREPFVTTETLLMAEIPQNSQWAFSPEPAGTNTILE